MALTPTGSVEPERQPHDRAQMLFELAGLGADVGPVAAVVHAGRHLVREQPLPHAEQLDREDADVAERVHHRSRVSFGRRLHRVGGVGRRRQREPQDPVAMVVLHQRIGGERPVATARGHDRDLPVERHERFEQRGDLADRAPRVLGQRGVVDHGLALAVVAETARLHHRGRADVGERVGEGIERIDRRVRRHLEADPFEQLLLRQAVLRRFEGGGRREHRPQRLDEPGRIDGDVLELVGHQVDAGGELGETLEVVVGTDDRRRHLRGRRIRGRVQRGAGDLERSTGERQHAAELATADDADARHHRVTPTGRDARARCGSAWRGTPATVR